MAICCAAACALIAAPGVASGAATLSATLSIAGPATVAGGSMFTISPHAVVSGDNANVAEIDLAYPGSMAYLSVNNAGSQLPVDFLSSGGGGQTMYIGAIFGPDGVGGDILVDNTTLRAGCLASTATIKYLSTTGVAAVSTSTAFPLTEHNKKITVTAAPPSTACAAPSFSAAGAKTRKITIYGSNFSAGTTVSLGAGITTTAVTVASPTKLVATTAVDPAATVGDRDITVTRPDSSTLTCTACFTVNPAPTATRVSPNSLARGTVTPVSVYGSGFVNGAKVTVSGTGVTASVTLVLGGRVDASLTVAAGAATGARSVTVHNSDGSVGVCHNCLTIT